MAGRLEGKVAIVTGAGRGIGRGEALALAKEGARVIVNDFGGSTTGEGGEHSPAEQVVAEIKAFGGEALPNFGNVASMADGEGMVKQAMDAWGRLDILVNNAGTNIRKAPHLLSLAEWHAVIDTNLTSAFLASHAAYPQFKRAGGGKIVNIGSMMSIFGASFAPAYAASKGGIVQFTKACASAWARDNIQVNAVLPGWIDTELTRGAREQVPGLHERVLERTPAGRWGAPDDLAGVAAFLCSGASDFVTGTAIPIDGGYSING